MNDIRNSLPSRWVLPTFFLVGYLSTYSHLEGYEIEYFNLTFLSIIAAFLLLTRLKPPLHQRLPILVIMTVLVLAYYFKFYLIVWNPNILRDNWIHKKLFLLIQSPAVLLETFATISYAFIIFCVTAWFLLGRRSPRPLQTEPLQRIIDYRSAIAILQWLLPVLMAVTAFAMYIMGTSRMGADNPQLPFRIAGWIFYCRLILIQALLLLFIWFADILKDNNYFRYGIFLLFIHGVSDMLLRSSRGAILMPFIMLLMLLFLTGKSTRKRLQGFLFIIIITIILFPVISSYRDLRTADVFVPIGSSFVEAIYNISSPDSSHFLESIKESGISIIFRLTGTESLMHIINSDIQPLYAEAFTGSRDVTRLFTVDVMGFPDFAIHSEAPSLLGWFYLVGGNTFVLIGIFGFTLFTWISWVILNKTNMRSLPVGQALVSWWIFGITSEGALDGQVLVIISILGSILACELLIVHANSKKTLCL